MYGGCAIFGTYVENSCIQGQNICMTTSFH